MRLFLRIWSLCDIADRFSGTDLIRIHSRIKNFGVSNDNDHAVETYLMLEFPSCAWISSESGLADQNWYRTLLDIMNEPLDSRLFIRVLTEDEDHEVLIHRGVLSDLCAAQASIEFVHHGEADQGFH